MAKTGTYALIASNTLGSDTATITFSSIPQTFTDLILVVNGNTTIAGTGANAIRVRFNSDTATNYSQTGLFGNGTSAGSNRDTSLGYMPLGEIGQTSGVVTTSILQFMDYANTTTFKTTLSRGNASNFELNASAGLWRSTSAISQIDLVLGSGSYKTGSTFYLYGIQALNGAV